MEETRRPPHRHRRLTPGILALLLPLLLVSCAPESPFRSSVRLGGVQVPAEVLNAGYESYQKYCRQCHGRNGNGTGPAGRHQSPPPRDFRNGLFKFGSIPAGQLPTDQDLLRVVERGLEGTQMLAWDVSPEEAVAVIQYLKTFSAKWTDGRPGTPIEISVDPWSGHSEARNRGSFVYHVLARCWGCHPAHLDQAALDAMSPGLELRENAHLSLWSDSSYGFPIAAPDLSQAPFRSGHTPADIYRTIAAGIGGTSMPTWKGALSEEDLWALVHYVDQLRLLP